MEQLGGPDTQLNPRHVASDVTGGKEAGTEVCLSQNSYLCFSCWSLYAAHTPHLNGQGQGMNGLP